jgi:hypothetical protein
MNEVRGRPLPRLVNRGPRRQCVHLEIDNEAVAARPDPEEISALAWTLRQVPRDRIRRRPDRADRAVVNAQLAGDDDPCVPDKLGSEPSLSVIFAVIGYTRQELGWVAGLLAGVVGLIGG